MTANGYPDFQRNSQQSGPALISVVSAAADGTAIYGPISVAIWPAISVLLHPLATFTNYFCTFTFYADAAMAFPLGTVKYEFSGSSDVADQVVCYGPWMRVEVFTNTAAPNNKFNLTVAPYSQVTSRARPFASPGLINIQGSLLVPAANLMVSAAVVSSGDCYFFAYADAAAPNVLVTLEVQRQSGARDAIAQVLLNATFGAQQSQRIYVPPMQVLAFAVNNGAGNANVYITVIPAS